jgi:transposase-like protein
MEERQRARAPRTSAAQRAVWLERLAQSGQTVRTFAREQGLAESKVYRWLWAARHRASPSPGGASPSFATLELSEPAAERWAAEVSLGSGRCVRLRAGTPVDWVRALVEALRG